MISSKNEIKQQIFEIKSLKIDDKDVSDIEVFMTNYSNRILIIISQINKLGTFVILINLSIE